MMLYASAPPAFLAEVSQLVTAQSQTFLQVFDTLVPVYASHGMTFSGRFGSDPSLAQSFFVTQDEPEAEQDYRTFFTPVTRRF